MSIAGQTGVDIPGLSGLGVYAVTVAILLLILNKVWSKFDKIIDERHEDQKVMTAALEHAASAVTEFLKITEREKYRNPPRFGDE